MKRLLALSGAMLIAAHLGPLGPLQRRWIGRRPMSSTGWTHGRDLGPADLGGPRASHPLTGQERAMLSPEIVTARLRRDASTASPRETGAAL